MTERERLIDLLNDVIDLPCDGELISDIANHLLDNGVILPPVKVGDTVYIISRHNGIHRRKVVEILMAEECSFVVGGDIYSEERYHFSYIGKTVFLSREEAEAALNKTDLSAGFRKMG